jgi:hypothetical protein
MPVSLYLPTVTLWEASTGAPQQLAPTKTDGNSRFELRGKSVGSDSILYLIAAGGEAKAKKGSGDNPGIVLPDQYSDRGPFGDY